MSIEILKVVAPLLGAIILWLLTRWSSAPSLSRQRNERLRDHLLKRDVQTVPCAVLQMDVSEAFGCRINLEPDALRFILARPDAWKVLRDYIASRGFIRFKSDRSGFMDPRRKPAWWSAYRTWGRASWWIGFALYAYFLVMVRLATSNSDALFYVILMLAAPVLGILLSLPCHAAQRLLDLDGTPTAR